MLPEWEPQRLGLLSASDWSFRRCRADRIQRGRKVLTTAPPLCYDSRTLQGAEGGFHGHLAHGNRARGRATRASRRSKIHTTLQAFLLVSGLYTPAGPVAPRCLLSLAKVLHIRLLVQRACRRLGGMRAGLGGLQGSSGPIPRNGPHGTQRARLPVHLHNHENFRESLEQTNLDSAQDGIRNRT